MSTSQRRFFSGSTLDQALMRAARHHELDPTQVAYRIVEKRHGFLRIRRRLVIEVDPESPRRMAAVAAESAATETRPRDPGAQAQPRRASEGGRREQRPPARRPPPRERVQAPDLVALPERPRPLRDQYPPATGAVALAAEKAMGLALGLIRARLEVRVLQGDGRLEIDLWGEDEHRLVADDGALLLALQQLLPRLIRGFIGETVPCRVDCDGFHVIREERLRELAQRIAAEVRQDGRPRALEPMPPDERRVIHVTLADDAAVTTHSVGEGYIKRVKIEPAS